MAARLRRGDRVADRVTGIRQAGRLARRIGLDATIALAFAFTGCGLASPSSARCSPPGSPPRCRPPSGPRTVAQALAVAAPGRAREVITAFVAGADAGLRVIGTSVLVLGTLVGLQSLLSRRSG